MRAIHRMPHWSTATRCPSLNTPDRQTGLVRDADMYGVEAIVSVELAGQSVPAT